MIASSLLPILLAGAVGWVDPSDDLWMDASPPLLDLIGFEASVDSQSLILTLSFNENTTSQADLLSLVGFIDLDTDFNIDTGTSTHLEDFDWQPIPEIGVDYSLSVGPSEDGEHVVAELMHIEDGLAIPIGTFQVATNGLQAIIHIPRCTNNSDDGICLGDVFRLIAIIGNFAGPTDRIPNGSFALVVGAGDVNHDGFINQDDVNLLASCRSGPGIPFGNGCADADLDLDGDVDQDDFAILQRHYTGT